MKPRLKLLLWMVVTMLGAGWVQGSAQAETQWTGAISSNVTWTKSGSPHRIVGGDLQIASSATVTIEAGAQVILGGNGININGRILAQGTAEDPITIGNVSQSAQGGSLVFYGSTPSEMRYCHASYMIRWKVMAASPQGNHLFDHCIFRGFGDDTISLDRGCARILNCIFRETQGDRHIYWQVDVLVDANIPTIQYNVFDKNALRGSSHCVPSFSMQGKKWFANNRVAGGSYGVCFDNGGGGVSTGFFNGLAIYDCDLAKPTAGVKLEAFTGNGVIIRGCAMSILYISGNISTFDCVSNNWWGLYDTTVINSQRVYYTYGSASNIQPGMFSPFLMANPFPQADVDNSDSGNDTKQEDADIVKKCLVGLATLTPSQRDIADVDRDGKVDIRDALMIESYVKGLIWKLPPR